MKRNQLKNAMLALGVCALLLNSSCQSANQQQEQESSLKEAFVNQYLIGTAMNTPQLIGADTLGIKLIKKQFNSVVAENCMKCEVIHPKENEYNFTLSDQFVDFAEANNMKAIGHTLIWHSQLADWFCVDEKGNDVSREVLVERMKQHIHTIVSRYKGRIHGWDVVNEAFEDDGSFRKSKFYQIIGEDYIKLAFQFAHEADPDAELYYNDYSMFHSGKRQGVVALVEKLLSEGVKIDGIGMQAHYGLSYPSMGEMENSILAFSETGVDVMITELDLTLLPSPFELQGANVADRFTYKESMDPYKAGLPDSVAIAFNKRYTDFFELFLKHQDKISRVTFWGVSDANSWKNDWPIKGRTDFPLLFDRNYQAKPVVEDIVKLVNK